MKKLYLNTDNVFAFDSDDVDDDTFNVQLSIVGEDGVVLKDNQGNDLILLSAGDNPALTFDSELKQFTGTIHFAVDTKRQYVRAFWVATDENDLPIALAGYYPEEISVESTPSDATQTYRQMIVPKSYFVDTFLGSYPTFSGVIVSILAEIEARNRRHLGINCLHHRENLKSRYEQDSSIHNFILTRIYTMKISGNPIGYSKWM